MLKIAWTDIVSCTRKLFSAWEWQFALEHVRLFDQEEWVSGERVGTEPGIGLDGGAGAV